MINLRPSAFIRLTTSIRPLSARPLAPTGRGSTTAISKNPRMPDSTTTPTANKANSETGCGSALPSHSTTCRKRVIRVSFGWAAGFLRMTTIRLIAQPLLTTLARLFESAHLGLCLRQHRRYRVRFAVVSESDKR